MLRTPRANSGPSVTVVEARSRREDAAQAEEQLLADKKTKEEQAEMRRRKAEEKRQKLKAQRDALNGKRFEHHMKEAEGCRGTGDGEDDAIAFPRTLLGLVSSKPKGVAKRHKCCYHGFCDRRAPAEVINRPVEDQPSELNARKMQQALRKRQDRESRKGDVTPESRKTRIH